MIQWFKWKLWNQFNCSGPSILGFFFFYWQHFWSSPTTAAPLPHGKTHDPCLDISLKSPDLLGVWSVSMLVLSIEEGRAINHPGLSCTPCLEQPMGMVLVVLCRLHPSILVRSSERKITQTHSLQGPHNHSWKDPWCSLWQGQMRPGHSLMLKVCTRWSWWWSSSPLELMEIHKYQTGCISISSPD